MVRHQYKDNPKEGVRDNGRVFLWSATALTAVGIAIDVAGS